MNCVQCGVELKKLTKCHICGKAYNLKPCPFCGSIDIDAEGVMYDSGKTSPQCISCGATSESRTKWNKRIAK